MDDEKLWEPTEDEVKARLSMLKDTEPEPLDPTKSYFYCLDIWSQWDNEIGSNETRLRLQKHIPGVDRNRLVKVMMQAEHACQVLEEDMVNSLWNMDEDKRKFCLYGIMYMGRPDYSVQLQTPSKLRTRLEEAMTKDRPVKQDVDKDREARAAIVKEG